MAIDRPGSWMTDGNRLDRVAGQDRPVLACYFSMGDPLFDDAIRDIYADYGVDIVELGIPTQRPYLDGPDVAAAMARALTGPVDPYDRMRDIVGWLGADPDRPAGVCMAYADLDLGKIDPVTRAGLDGLLMVGGEERSDRKDLALILDQDDIRNCGLVPIGFSQHHLHVARHLNGYVMIQASAGVTGPRPALSEGLGASIAQLRRAGISRPILAGFGIGTAEQARHAVACGADGVVIGSMCVRKVVEGANAIRAFLAEVRSALDV